MEQRCPQRAFAADSQLSVTLTTQAVRATQYSFDHLYIFEEPHNGNSKTSSFKIKHFYLAHAWLVKQKLQCCQRKCSVVFPIFVFFNCRASRCAKVHPTEWTRVHVLGSVLSDHWGKSCRSVPLAAGLAAGCSPLFDQPTYFKRC